ncbi:uncharacterized protein K02A2.6-like [Lineus longissimus]|uniref:uncharacterized protein K02A2.6-like n=1 Tax=Lineus longissimus TaxID=88925 RepID=UPI00315CADD1
MYAVIEKELLAICFGCKKFHDYVYGKGPITIETDHKPLLAIMTKPIHKLSARMQRMRLRLQHYDLKLVYRPGREMFLADTLSRAFVSDTNPQDLFDDKIEVNLLNIASHISDAKLEEFKSATDADPTLQSLKNTVMQGWPDDKQDVPLELTPYFPYRDEITLADNLLLKGDRLVVPETLRANLLKRIHETHMGIVKSKQLARDILFWPGMGQQIEDTVSRCTACQTARKSQPAEPMIPHNIPDLPWSKVATDMFEYRSKEYLLTVDYFSKFPEVCILPTLTSQSVITALKASFSRFGIPNDVISDNGPQFSSREFSDFSKAWGFRHTTSSPGYPQSNGQVERAIQSIKDIFKKCEQSCDDPSIALLNFRNTPLDGVGQSPAQLLMSRRLNSKLPILPNLLKPKVVDNAHEKLTDRQNRQKQYYDKRVSNSTNADIHPGDAVRFRTLRGQWKYGTVQDKLPDVPRSYNIQTPEGKSFRRNRRHMFQTRENNIPNEGTRPRVMYTSGDPPHAPANDHTDVNVAPQAAVAEPIPTINNTPGYVTRSGRTSKPPDKLDL